MKSSSLNSMSSLIVVLLVVLIPLNLGLVPGRAQGRAQGNLTPIILIYTGVNDDYAEMLASLIKEDDGVEADVFVTADSEMISLGASLPNTMCIVVHADNAAEMAGLEESLLVFFEDGGGLIGMKDACYLPSAGELAAQVFPTFANFSVRETSPNGWARTYLRDESTEINSDLPESFELMSMGTYFSADGNGGYLQVPGDYAVLFRDQETSSPQVLVNENEKGGRSVAFPGTWVVSTSRIAVYYGNLVANENFAKLFTNSVNWAKGSTRFISLSEEWVGRLQEVEDQRLQLVEEAEERKRKESARKTYTLIGLWAMGLIASGLITRRIILSPDSE